MSWSIWCDFYHLMLPVLPKTYPVPVHNKLSPPLKVWAELPLNRMWCWGHGTMPMLDLCNKSNILLKNDRPGLTTLHAWLSLPKGTQVLSSHITLQWFCFHNVLLRWSSFSTDRRKKLVVVSTSIPINTSFVHGHSHLCSARGMLSSAQVYTRVSRYVVSIGEHNKQLPR